jgi:peptidoglycan biosynthesis protein MviN/MurJ (putative lipid II flippase)
MPRPADLRRLSPVSRGVPPLSSGAEPSPDEDRRVFGSFIAGGASWSVSGLLILGLFGQSLLDLLIGHGNINAGNVEELWWIMIWLGGMFAGGAMGQISSSSFFALGDTSTPTRLGIYSYTFYIPAKIALFYYFGTFGLALATSLFFVANFSGQHHLLKINHSDFLHEEVLYDDK